METFIALPTALEAFRGAMYIDPASTSLIIQIAAGVAISAGAALGIYWGKVKRAVKKKSGEEAPAAEMKGADDGKDVITAADLLDDDDDE